jgi:hypothetical protein
MYIPDLSLLSSMLGVLRKRYNANTRNFLCVFHYIHPLQQEVYLSIARDVFIKFSNNESNELVPVRKELVTFFSNTNTSIATTVTYLFSA